MKKILTLATIFILAFTNIALAMDKIVITDSWLWVPPNKVAGAFFEIKNNTDKTLNIVSATTKGAKKIELHNHIMADGIMKMRQVKAIEVPANGSTSFNPHGFHLMMYRLDKDMFAAGNMVEVNFTFDDQSTASAKFHVMPFGQPMEKSMDHQNMDHSKMDHSKMDMGKSDAKK
ncbi:MAG: copper chaperone PCu(A)C [Alphaproteobacteria bacterium]|nr:copper chaperone PCu(A)C [Alphaproteobacteria bacterium]